MFRLLLALTAALWASLAFAADQPEYGPPPAWVRPAEIPDKVPEEKGAAIQALLADSQVRFHRDGDEFYAESAVKVLSSDGLAVVGAVSQVWKPDTDTLVIHKIHLIRDGKVIDVLAGGKKLTVLRRENNLERAMLDGALTATLQLEDVRVGDILNVAITLRRRDPVYQGHSEAMGFLGHTGVAGRIRYRTLWSAPRAVRWRTTAGLAEPTLKREAEDSELLLDLRNIVAPKPPMKAPARFRNVGRMEISDFKSWAEVSGLLAAAYKKAAVLEPQSPLKAEAAKIRAAHKDPKARAAAALQLVQDQVRYVFLGMNLGGYLPAAADVTWSRRFGDCKGKTALLVALLNELDIDAQAALVSASRGDGLDQRLPMLSAFDHVIVRTVIGGRTYWLDGTRSGDGQIDDIRTPSFDWALPVQASGASLERLVQEPLKDPEVEKIVRIDASAGIDKPASAQMEVIYRQDMAITLYRMLAALGRTETDRYLREFWTSDYSWVKADKVDFIYDEPHQTLRLTMQGAGVMEWSRDQWGRDFDIEESSLGWRATFQREPGPNQDAPYVVSHPDYQKWTVTIALPDKGAGFLLIPEPHVDKTIAQVAYRRSARIDNGVVVMEASQRSLAPEFPYAEADSAAAALRDLARYNVNVRFRPTSRVGSSSEAALTLDKESTPVDAPGFARRGALNLLNGDYDKAIADYTRAADLEPKVAKHVYNRGVAHYEKGERSKALSDFSRALALRGDDILALTARGQLYLDLGDDRKAKKDLDETLRIAAGDGRTLSRVGGIYLRGRRFEAAVEAFDLWLARYPESERRAEILATRCFAAGAWGQGYDQGLKACEASLALQAAYAPALAARGLIRLRQSRWQDAVSDFDHALATNPGDASALYGRGVAKQRLGQKGADADFALALEQNPEVKDEFKAYRLEP